MNDPLRLVDAGGTEFERLLLTAAAEEAPSSEISARMLAGVATAGAAVALFSSAQLAGDAVASGATIGAQAGVSAAAAAGAGGSIAPPAAAGLAGAGLIKWGLIGALAMGGVVSGFRLLEGGAGPVAGRAGAAPSAQLAPLPAEAPRRHDVAPTSAQEVSPTVVVAPAPVAAVRTPSNQRTSQGGAQARALGPEIDLLDSARRALAAGDAERALSLITSYHRRFPTGALSQEATVLEVDALEAKGRAEQATDLKQQFLAEHPESAHTQRVQRSGLAR